MNAPAVFSRFLKPGLGRADRQLAEQIRAEGLTYLTDMRLRTLARELSRLDANAVPGAVLEFGVASGGSAVFLARRAVPARQFIGFDLFGMIPPPGPQDPPEAHARHAEIRAGKSQGLNGQPYYGYVPDLMQQVTAVLDRYGVAVDGKAVRLVPGLFEETVPGALPDRVALAHVDCDWYDPVLHCLTHLAPRLAPGACVVLDDYHDWEGCRRAADDFLARSPGFSLTQTRPNAVIRRA
jgi:asparagine synthase (glutamine-hydrolysing)